MGRKPSRGANPIRGKYRPRVIDLDLLFFDKEVINTRALMVRIHGFMSGALSSPRWRNYSHADASEVKRLNF